MLNFLWKKRGSIPVTSKDCELLHLNKRGALLQYQGLDQLFFVIQLTKQVSSIRIKQIR